MVTFSQRFPTGRQILLVFAACVVPVFSWAIFHFLERMPGWLYYQDILSILGIFAYTQAFALVESLLLLAGLVLLYLFLPRRLFNVRFDAAATAIVLLSAGWAIPAQYFDQTLRVLPAWQFLLLVALYAGSIVGALLLLHRSAGVERFLVSLSERLTVFLYLYVPLGLLSVITIILRNLS